MGEKPRKVLSYIFTTILTTTFVLRAGVSGSYVPRLHCCLAPCLLCYSIFPLDFSSALPDCHVPSLQCLNSFACWSLCGAKSMDPSRQDHWRCRVECCTIKCCCPGCIKPLKFNWEQLKHLAISSCLVSPQTTAGLYSTVPNWATW